MIRSIVVARGQCERVRPRSELSRQRCIALCIVAALCLVFCLSCSRKPDPNTVVVIIENSPTNLDPRVGIDAQSERIGELIFASLVRRDDHFELKPLLAESWEI